jgi:hypothetical protein
VIMVANGIEIEQRILDIVREPSYGQLCICIVWIIIMLFVLCRRKVRFILFGGERTRLV